MGPVMQLNGLVHRHVRSNASSNLKLHLGPAQNNYLSGWVNLDANSFTARCDMWVDLRFPLPFKDNVASAVYSHHMIEHLPSIQSHLQEVFRCLQPEGVDRFEGPNGDSAISKFKQNDLNWFGDFPNKRTSIGGKLENFIFCRQEHLTLLTESYLRELLNLTRICFFTVKN